MNRYKKGKKPSHAIMTMQFTLLHCCLDDDYDMKDIYYAHQQILFLSIFKSVSAMD